MASTLTRSHKEATVDTGLVDLLRIMIHVATLATTVFVWRWDMWHVSAITVAIIGTGIVAFASGILQQVSRRLLMLCNTVEISALTGFVTLWLLRPSHRQCLTIATRDRRCYATVGFHLRRPRSVYQLTKRLDRDCVGSRSQSAVESWKFGISARSKVASRWGEIPWNSLNRHTGTPVVVMSHNSSRATVVSAVIICRR